MEISRVCICFERETSRNKRCVLLLQGYTDNDTLERRYILIRKMRIYLRVRYELFIYREFIRF